MPFFSLHYSGRLLLQFSISISSIIANRTPALIEAIAITVIYWYSSLYSERKLKVVLACYILNAK